MFDHCICPVYFFHDFTLCWRVCVRVFSSGQIRKDSRDIFRARPIDWVIILSAKVQVACLPECYDSSFSYVCMYVCMYIYPELYLCWFMPTVDELADLLNILESKITPTEMQEFMVRTIIFLHHSLWSLLSILYEFIYRYTSWISVFLKDALAPHFKDERVSPASIFTVLDKRVGDNKVRSVRCFIKSK